MPILLFLGNTVCYAGQSSLGKLYASKGGHAHGFNLCKAGSAAILFLVWLFCKGQGIHWYTLPWAAVYGICLCVSMYAGFQALSCGPMALTSILAAMSLIVPFLWGILFWQEQPGMWSIVGFCCLLCSILLINFKNEGKISGKWLLYCMITMITNGFCSVIQKYHQFSYPGRFQVDFMLMSMAAVTVLLLLILPFQKEKRIQISLTGISSGILNGLANFIVLILASNQSATTLFPIVSACNVMAAWFCGILFFRDRIQKQQLLGLFCGIAGIILMQFF